jgi:hypothetical protein
MAETVVVTPKFGHDDDGNPVDDGTPVTLMPIAIAPGNTLQQPAAGGELDEAEFTLFFGPTVFLDGTRQTTADLIKDDYGITVRDRPCLIRVQDWRSPRTGRGGLVVLARSATGKS